MKKTYIEPNTISVVLKCERILGTLSSGDGNVHMNISSEGASSEAEGRRSNSIWDDEE